MSIIMSFLLDFSKSHNEFRENEMESHVSMASNPTIMNRVTEMWCVCVCL